MRALHRVYNPLFDCVAAARRSSRVAARARPDRRCGVVALPAARRRVHAEARGGQLLDPRDAADVDLARAVGEVRRPDARRSCAAARRIRTCRATRRTARTPRSTTVVSQLGRPDDGTDVSGFYNIELFAPLKPFDEWPRGRDQGQADRRAQRGAQRGVPRRRLQLLADDQRQRRRGASAASRARTRSRCSAPTSRATRRTPTRSST